MLGLLLPASSQAQIGGYSGPGQLPTLTQGVPAEETFREAIEEAKWHLGGFHLTPYGGLRDLRYSADFVRVISGDVEEDDEILVGTEADLTATLGAGLRGYLPVGSNVIWTLYGGPDYVWWLENSDRSGWRGRYGTGLFAYPGRLSLQVSAEYLDQQTLVTSEIEEPIGNLEQRIEARAGYRIGSAFELHIGATIRDLEFDTGVEGSDEIVSRLNRESDRYGAGLTYTRGHLELGIGAELTEDRFDDPTRPSNEGTALILQGKWERSHLFTSARIEFRTLKPLDQPNADETDTNTGSLVVGYHRNKLEISLYGRRSLNYSIFSNAALFEQTALGIRGLFRMGERFTLIAFGEDRDQDYLDDLGNVEENFVSKFAGLDLQIRTYRNLRTWVGLRYEDRESFQSGLTRSVTYITGGITLNASGLGTSGWY